MTLVGKMIKWHRNKKSYTQEQLAEGICSVTQLSKIENNQIPANEDILFQIAERLNIDQYKLTNYADTHNLHQVKQWMTYIHEYDLINAKKLYIQLQSSTDTQAHYDIEFLYELALFGYYLMTDQVKKADQLYQTIYEYETLFEAVDAYSFYKFTGEYYKNKGLYIDALNQLEQAEEYSKDVEDPELLILLAIVYSHLEKVLTSNAYARRALRIFQDKLYYTRIIECEIVISVNYIYAHDLNVAEQHLQRLITLIDDKFDVKAIVKIYFHLGFIQAIKRDFDQAELSLKRCLQFNINEPELLHCRYLIAHLYYMKEDFEMAVKYIGSGMSMAKEYNIERYLIKFHVLNLLIEKDEEGLIDYLKKKAIPFFRITGQSFDLTFYYQLLGYTLYQLKRYKSAAEILMGADEQRKRLMNYKFDTKY
ncbi:helix-turn-helix domain-containing protein [Tenuibacillus multivorans]|uniref:Helix-turn-helix n=1 Tax=Tenuibacillus multivorans TaxID=237069 RepID=A0A1G9WXW0_9BACI|nr:helix-turn-helix transcriptional regulator [Tenuibacillus multivorans]GEL77319.1 hypothetical protein TMU01_15540 [Tenuibacillus multivorans]SDM89006.1 Helix-turn-helix [Tenuibacillus multivorans]